MANTSQGGFKGNTIADRKWEASSICHRTWSQCSNKGSVLKDLNFIGF
jgi:hypothetical protein